MQHELLYDWSWFIHIESHVDTYVTSYKKIFSFNTCEGWARVINYIPDAGTLTSDNKNVLCNGEKVMAYSLFRTGIMPQWEDIRNEHGCEWGCRQEMDADNVSIIWKHIIASMVGGDLDVLGARVVNKNTYSRRMTKIEVWLGEEHDPAEIYGKIQRIISDLRLNSECPNFQILHHDIKTKETIDQNEKRKRKKNKFEKNMKVVDG